MLRRRETWAVAAATGAVGEAPAVVLCEGGEVSHAERGEHVEGLLVDADLVDLERRLVWDEVRAALALLLQLE